MNKKAFVTFLMLNDSYLPGALMVGHALRKQNTGADVICMVTEDISESAVRSLSLVFDHLVTVETVYVEHQRRQERQDRPFWFTRLNALRLGKDGDLGFEYEKVVLLDADVLPVKNYASLLDVPAPAGILNEDKSKLMYLDGRERAGLTTWSWHDAYDAVCPHGKRIPKSITDRVVNDPSNMGLNGSLFILQPSMAEFRSIIEDIQRPEIKKLVSDKFTWPDMQYLSMRWSGKWHNVDIKYSAYNGYPRLEVLNGTHFAGVKPWYFKREPSTVRNHSRYEDFQLWFKEYRQMMSTYPGLGKSKKLVTLLDEVAANSKDSGSQ